MSLIPYTIYDTGTKLPKRTGNVHESLLGSHIIDSLAEGEDIVLGIEANLREERVVAPINGAAPYLRRRSQAEIDAARPEPSGVDPVDVVLEALRAKEIEITPEDLSAAETRLRAKARQA